MKKIAWGLAFGFVVSLPLWVLVAAGHSQKLTLPDPQSHPSPEFLRMLEVHCVAVLTEAHVEKLPTIRLDDQMPEIVDGYYIVHVPEKTAKLRCK